MYVYDVKVGVNENLRREVDEMVCGCVVAGRYVRGCVCVCVLLQ